MSKRNTKNKVKESDLLYAGKDLKIYTSVNKAAEAAALYISNQKPLDRIKETVELILRVFPLSERKANTNKIYIDKS